MKIILFIYTHLAANFGVKWKSISKYCARKMCANIIYYSPGTESHKDPSRNQV